VVGLRQREVGQRLLDVLLDPRHQLCIAALPALDLDACRHRDEKKSALAATEEALKELGECLASAEADLEAEIAEAGDLITEGEIALLPDRAAVHCERIARSSSRTRQFSAPDGAGYRRS
jgi:hypothetical protein